MKNYKDLLNRLIEFRDERDWDKFHTQENLAKSIVIEASELLEIYQWGDEVETHKIEDELADVLIYSFLLADKIGANPLEIMEQKRLRNIQRFPVAKVKGKSGKKERVD